MFVVLPITSYYVEKPPNRKLKPRYIFDWQLAKCFYYFHIPNNLFYEVNHTFKMEEDSSIILIEFTLVTGF